MAGARETQSQPQGFLPALRFPSLTPVFDPVVRLTTRERTFKRRLVHAVRLAPGESALDLGAGTGTLALMLKRSCPQAQVTGLDADPAVLAQARRKAQRAKLDVELVEAFSTELPFPLASFDAVVSTLFFHHLPSDDKRRTLAEVARVLRPGGRLHIADWGRPSDPAMGALFGIVRAFDGKEVTADNAAGRLPLLIEQAGLQEVRVGDRLRTPLGTLDLISATRP